jgi:L-threonylcarbamoyladenylate synthase
MNKIIKQAARFIEGGKMVCLPTETVYGLAVNAMDNEAVRRVYEIKGRDFKNPLSLMVKDMKSARKYVKVNEAAIRVAAEFCPGPISFVLPKSDDCTLDGCVNSNLKTLAIRIPNHEIISCILEEVNCPIAFTSANPSGAAEAVTAAQVRGYFSDEVDMVVEGDCGSGRASTIVDLCGSDAKILRNGEISSAMIGVALVGIE